MSTDELHKKFEVDQWVERYGDYLYRYALMRLRDPGTAEDAVQETFLAGIKHLEKFDGRVDVKYWLRGILKNKTVDHIRRGGETGDIDLFLRIDPIPTTRTINHIVSKFIELRDRNCDLIS